MRSPPSTCTLASRRTVRSPAFPFRIWLQVRRYNGFAMNPRFWLRLAALFFLSLTPVAALAQAAAQDEVTPQVQELYQQAKAAQQRGDNATAIEKYRAMLKLAPHLAPAYNNLGMLYFNQHDYAHAAEVLKKGLDINPDMPTASALLGMSYHEMGDHEQAEPLLEAAVRANPNDDN